MSRWPCVVIGVFGYLLTLTTSAGAECAWVLWGSGISDGQPVSDFPVDSFTSLRECKDAEKKYRKPRDPKTGDMANTVCLPDTVDPRGPKGQ